MTDQECAKILDDVLIVNAAIERPAIDRAIRRLTEQYKWEPVGMMLEGKCTDPEEIDIQDGYMCEGCGFNVFIQTRYCPNCGSKMKGHTAEWIDKGDVWDYYECSECGGGSSHKSRFCEHCGAMMEVNDGQQTDD